MKSNQLTLPTLNEVMANEHEQLLLTFSTLSSQYRSDKITRTELLEKVYAAVRENYNAHTERIEAIARKPKAVISADPVPTPLELAFHEEQKFEYVGVSFEEYADITDD
jgi:hypothetical protein